MSSSVVAPFDRRVWWGLLGIWVVYAVVLGAHIFSHENVHSVDGMYHIRFAWLYAQRGIFTDFPWMQFSIPSDIWTDHHFLFHLLLIPFTRGDLVWGMKLASVVFGSLAFAGCVAYLILHRVRYAWAYGLVLLVASDIFLFRISMPRSISISLLFLLAALFCLERRHHRSLFAIAFLYIWAYQTAIVLLPMAGWAVLVHRFAEKQWDFRPLLYVTAGLIVGLAIHPFSPKTFSFFAFHFFPAFPGQMGGLAPKIPEWEKLPPLDLVIRNFPAFFLAFLVPLLCWGKRHLWFGRVGMLSMGTVALWLASLGASRMLEYGVPFAVLLGARILDASLFGDESAQGEISAWAEHPKRRTFWVVGLVVCCCLFAGAGWKYHRDFSRHAFDVKPHLFQGAARWLATHTPAKSVVYHTDWASFSYLFFENTHNTYISGLSPLFFYAWRPKLYRIYRTINAGRTKRPAHWIRTLFRSRYVALSNRRANFPLARQLEANPQVKRVFEDARVRVYQLP